MFTIYAVNTGSDGPENCHTTTKLNTYHHSSLLWLLLQVSNRIFFNINQIFNPLINLCIAINKKHKKRQATQMKALLILLAMALHHIAISTYKHVLAM